MGWPWRRSKRTRTRVQDRLRRDQRRETTQSESCRKPLRANCARRRRLRKSVRKLRSNKGSLTPLQTNLARIKKELPFYWQFFVLSSSQFARAGSSCAQRKVAAVPGERKVRRNLGSGSTQRTGKQTWVPMLRLRQRWLRTKSLELFICSHAIINV